MELIKKNLGKVAITCDGKWDINKSYDKLSLVYDNKTNISYISKQDVPIGINIDNITYWQKFQLNNGSSPVEGEGIDNVYLLPINSLIRDFLGTKSGEIGLNFSIAASVRIKYS